jgi:nicotinamidase-related amidase
LRGLLAAPGSRDAEFLDEVAPAGDEVVIEKTSSGAFNSSAIDQVLRNLGIEHLLACGVATNACVEMTVRDAADRNYQVTLVHDACAAMSEALHQAALLTMDGFMGLVRVASTDEVVKILVESPLEKSEVASL